MSLKQSLLQHPLVQNRLPLIAGGASILLVGAVVFFTSSGESKQQVARPTVPVVTAQTEQRNIDHMIEVAGTVESLQSVVIRAQVDGVMTTVRFQEGDLVEAGQVLATIDDRSLQAALSASKAQLASDKAQLHEAEMNLARYQELVTRNAVSRQMLDNQVAVLGQRKAAVQMSEAAVKTAEVNLSYTRITSPVTGRVGIRRVDAGNYVRASDANGLVTVAQVDPISVLFPVPQDELAKLRQDAASAGGGTVQAFNRDTGELIAQGRISAFDNVIDAATGTAKIRAVFDNNPEKLSPGQFVAIRARTGMTPNALVVPAVAVRPGLEGQYVFRIVNNAAQRRDVKLGYTDGDVAVIAEGLDAGDQVVVDGMSRLTEGVAVKARQTDNNANTKAPKAKSELPGGPVMGMQ